MDKIKAEISALSQEVEGDLANLTKYRGDLLKTESLQTTTIKASKAHAKTLAALNKQLQASSKTADPAHVEELKAEIKKLQDALHQVSFMEPRTGSLFVRLFLGRVNVKAALQRDRMRLRDEYDKFKRRTNILFLLIPMALMATSHEEVSSWLRYTHWVPMIAQVWLLYYYVSLALRENILRVNGSKIMAWWIFHHYVSAFMSIVLLTWPDTPLFRSMLRPFSYYFLYQGTVQLVQSWYQQSRHYALVSTGRTSRIDPSHSEGLRESQTGFWVLVGMLLIAYCAQAYMGVSLLQVLHFQLDLSQPWYLYKEEVQTLSLGCCFLLLAVGNLFALLTTLYRKTQRRGPGAKKGM